MFLRTETFSYMFVFIDGQIMTGQVTARRKVLSASSAIPPASFPIIFAVAGATTTASASFAHSMCLIEELPPFSKRSVHTGLPERASNVSEPTKAEAFFVMMTLAPASCFLISLRSSALLYAAIPPLTPRTMFLPFIYPILSRPPSDIEYQTLYFEHRTSFFVLLTADTGLSFWSLVYRFWFLTAQTV